MRSRPQCRADPVRAAGFRAVSCSPIAARKTFSRLAGTRTKMRSGRNQRGQTRDSIVEQAGTSVEAEQGLGTISAGGRPKACAKAAGDDQRRSAITKRARRWPVQSPPSSLSLVSNRRGSRPSGVSSFASKRNTSAGWVLEARTSPHPSVKIHPHPVDFSHVIVGAEKVGEPGDDLEFLRVRDNRLESREWSRPAAGH